MYMKSMGMSFFISCPVTGGLSVPRKSGHTCNADLNIIPHGARCPDLSGTGTALLIGHEIKKDIPMFGKRLLSPLTLKRSAGVMCDNGTDTQPTHL